VYISSIALRNFRCFGPTTANIPLSKLTALLGTNGCGKTAVLQALSRMFGFTSTERTVEKSDFHVALGKSLESQGETSLAVEVILEFPELEAKKASDAVPTSFQHMVVEGSGKTPYCRVRLEALWSPSSLPEGEIEQRLFWIMTPDEPVVDKDKKAMRPADRSFIQVCYVPASRTPVRNSIAPMIQQLLAAIPWQKTTQTAIEDAAKKINDSFEGEVGIKSITRTLEDSWAALQKTELYKSVALRPTNSRLEQIIRQVDAHFSPGPGQEEYELSRLSDGMKSLFYLAFVKARFGISSEIAEGGEAAKGFDKDELQLPALTIVALEEPENHLAPHYLGGIMDSLNQVAASPHGQVVLTSHAPSIMSRIPPENVRHLRLNKDNTTTANSIVIPAAADSARTFVREAVQAYPELYFAQLVVLCEGDSEQVVLPRFANARSVPIDPSFISIVPLGGRHVNHFWKLLEALAIPYVTLLDLDLERECGGWSRIKYVLTQLIENGKPKKSVLDGISESDLSQMHDWDESKIETMMTWVEHLHQFNVFFSAPLDLDFCMLEAYPDAYKATADEGPDIPTGSALTAATAAVSSAVLGEGKGTTYTEKMKSLFFWYRYLFLNRSKPDTHLAALSPLKSETLLKTIPRPIDALFKCIATMLGAADAKQD